MADLAKWGVAVAPGLGFAPEEFLRVYTANRAESSEIALDASPVAQALRSFMAKAGKGKTWSGKLADLLQHLRAESGGMHDKSRGWPQSVRGLGNSLRRSAPSLRQVGLQMDFPSRKKDGYYVVLWEG